MNLVERFTQRYGRVPTEFDRDYLEMLRMSKYRILTVPDIKPGKCANCGSSKEDGRGYVDFGLEVDWYGIVFLCGHCLFDIVRQMGLIRPLEDQISNLTDKLLKIKQNDSRGVDLRDNFLKIFKEVQNYISTLPATGNEPVTDSRDLPDKSEAASSEPTIDTIKRAADEAKQRIVKSASVPRSTNIPSLASLLDATDK